MSSTPKRPPDRDEDLTARARIRDAAVECFARHGFDVTVRAIAERAGVSPGLVLHHFGSKAGLRETCDEYVRQTIRETKTEAVTAHGEQTFLQQLAEIDEYSDLLGYVLRSLQAGGPMAVALFEHMVEDIEEYLAKGEEAGTIRPSRDPKARARWLAANGLGSITMLFTLQGLGPDTDFRELLRRATHDIMLPALEVYTEGLLTERTMLDAYLLYISDPPEEPR
ncbi:TetR/AcrR family transcriptional regulator [Nocardiopsis sp. NRRL B-16309]|uniref:TetR/AcrR family transcriptional regulator n=1 Tax=Nocardiopsis sp. NRRL B-16309 TaxID=1519494 RepID=UPI0006B0233D|nr:TetR family transcriptional regulator [Nocardiopsis sp. NRRL B-16309]KOX22178.1 TetR family transcriptional regulator [Nocardiopsis sp. NRRL B-16309]